MEPDQSWPRGRHGWNGDGHRPGMREGEIQSSRRMHHSGSPSHKFRPNRPIWDDTIHDLASMKLNHAELARKLASRQSSNKLLARAQLLEQSRWSASYSPNLPPALAARLQAARQQSVDFILAQSNSALMTSQKMRQSEKSSSPDLKTMPRQQEPDGAEEVTLYEYDVKQDDDPRKASLQKDSFDSSSSDRDDIRTARVDSKNETVKSHDLNNKTETSAGTFKESGQKDLPQDAPKQKAPSSRSAKGTRKPFDIRQFAATRASLDHTITMVVNTCRELWLQLEEERLTRERLQQQLQQQGNVITTLTAELLQIQDQQEAILQEVSDARASGLWGFEGDLKGGSSGSTDGGDDLISSHTVSDREVGGRPSPQSVSSRHPQRSILRATRTIHLPHLHQPPPYQTLQQTARTHQADSHLPMSHQPPHSPRPHQSSPRPHPQSLQSHQPSSYLSEPSMSLTSLAALRPETSTHSSYRSSVSRQIREALASELRASSVPDGNSASTQLNYANLPHEGLPEVKSSDKDMRAMGDKQTVASDNKENNLMSMGEDNVMDSSITELLERKSPEDFQKCIIYQCQVV